MSMSSCVTSNRSAASSRKAFSIIEIVEQRQVPIVVAEEFVRRELISYLVYVDLLLVALPFLLL